MSDTGSGDLGGVPVTCSPVGTPRMALPVWTHQLIAYGLGALIIGFGVHSPAQGQLQLLVGAALTIALAALTKGPLGAAKLIGPRLLRPAELITAAGLAVLPFVRGGSPRIEVIFTLEISAVMLLRLAFVAAVPGGRAVPARAAGTQRMSGTQRVSGSPPPGTRPLSDLPPPRTPPVSDLPPPGAQGASARSPGGPEVGQAAADAAEAAARLAGRKVGEAGRRVREAGVRVEPTMRQSARALGRMAGRRQARRAGGGTDPRPPEGAPPAPPEPGEARG
jgi:hypothetical protein